MKGLRVRMSGWIRRLVRGGRPVVALKWSTVLA